MTSTVCLAANTIGYPEGGGHLWVYLNWALGLRSAGCEVIWLEGVDPGTPPAELQRDAHALERRLAPYGFADRLALCSLDGGSLPLESRLDLDAAAEADLLLNLAYFLPEGVVGRFRRTALLDIDPGLLQIWMSTGQLEVAPHDLHFTTGETVAWGDTRIPDVGVAWQYTPPCVALDWWPLHDASPEAPFTTVTHWYEGYSDWVEYAGEAYPNGKRSGFLPFVELPRRSGRSLELALALDPEDGDTVALEEAGWRLRDSASVASTPWDYQRYIQDSRGEFSAAKPSCVRLQNAWLSDRTLCYLASGKPAVVQHTGPSLILPDAEGLFRFRDVDEAARALEQVEADYERHSRAARALAEEHFDARKVVMRLLEGALPRAVILILFVIGAGLLAEELADGTATVWQHLLDPIEDGLIGALKLVGGLG